MRKNYAELGYFNMLAPDRIEFIPGVDVDVAVKIMYEFSETHGGAEIYAKFNKIELGPISSNTSLDKIAVMSMASRRFWNKVGRN